MNKKLLLIIFAISGLTALIYEMIWIRPLTLVFGATIYAVSTIVASFILGLAIGSWLAGRYADRLNNPLRYFAFVQLGIGFYGILLLPIFGILPELYLGLYNATHPNQSFFMFLQILMSIGMISIPATLMGATLPLMMRTYSEGFSSVGKDVGKLDASNSMGAFFGTLAAGFLLIPFLGIQNSIILTASINVIMGIIILSAKKYLKYRYLIGIAIFGILLFSQLPSYDIKTINSGVFFHLLSGLTMEQNKIILDRQQVLFYKESMYASVLVASEGAHKTLTIRGHPQCSVGPYTTEALQRIGSNPYDLFEYNYQKPKNAVNIGLGCGATSKWLSENVNTTTLEIDPVVAEASKLFFDEIDVNLIIDDARNWFTRNDEKFDLIVTDPIDPYQDKASLYTLEYYSLLNSRLTENGLVSQWIPTYVMTLDDFHVLYNTFHSVFPYVYVYHIERNYVGEIIFIGSQKPLKVLDNKFYLVSNEDIPYKDTVLNTDDRPTIEFSTALNLYNPKPEQILNKLIEWKD